MELNAHDSDVSLSYRNKSLTLRMCNYDYDTSYPYYGEYNGNYYGYSYIILPNCATQTTTSDGRCATTEGFDDDGNGSWDIVVVSGENSHY